MESSQTKIRYFKVCPRGFANEVRYYAVRPDQVAEVDKEYADFADDVSSGGYAEWTNDKAASAPGVAVAWEDRNF